MRRLTKAFSVGISALVLMASQAAAEVRLMMIEEHGCMWCARWKDEIGPIYPKSAEGKVAPLFNVMITDPLEDGIELKSPAVYTPTFVLLDDGQEVGRIEGYPGEDFFWGLLGMMIETLPEEKRKVPGT